MIKIHFSDGCSHIDEYQIIQIKDTNLYYLLMENISSFKQKKKRYFRFIKLFLKDPDLAFNKIQNYNNKQLDELYKDMVLYGIHNIIISLRSYLYELYPEILPKEHLKLAYKESSDDIKETNLVLSKEIKKIVSKVNNIEITDAKDIAFVKYSKNTKYYYPTKDLEYCRDKLREINSVYKNLPIIVMILSQLAFLLSKFITSNTTIQKFKTLSKRDVLYISKLVFCTKGFVGILYRLLYKLILSIGISYKIQ